MDTIPYNAPSMTGHYSRHILLLLLVILLPVNWSREAVSRPVPLARKGVLDLTGLDFRRDNSVDLNGEWEFYWGRLIPPGEFAVPAHRPMTGFHTIPGVWNGRNVGGRKLDGNGCATFRLRVKIRPDSPLMAIRILDESSAYRLWINGGPVASNGVAGESRAATRPQYLLQLSHIPPGSGNLDIVLQVANFNHAKGGVWNPVTLGSEAALSRKQQTLWGMDLFLFGCLLAMGAYHLYFFLLRRSAWSALYFGLFCLTVAIRTALTEQRFFTTLFPGFSWELVFKAELLTVHVAFLLLLLFISSLYPEESNHRLTRPLEGVCAIFALITLFTPARISSLLVAPFHPIIIVIQACVFYVLLRAIVARRDGSAIILTGLTIFFLTVINDILYNHGVISTGYIAPFGFLFLAGSQSGALARRFARAFSTIEHLSAEREEHLLALSRMDQLKDEFLANTSHELRTPLNGIIGLAEAMGSGAAGVLPEKARTHLEMIAASGRRLHNLINDILDLVRLKNRDITLHRKAVDLRVLADTVLAVTGPLCRSKSLTPVNAIPDDLPPVDGDEDRLQQILFNLVGNAVKFTDQGTITISATIRDREAEVAVRDTGIGIPAGKLESIFNSFEQVDGSTARNHGGVGLGLGISRHLVELHGGRLWAESTPGSGSIFRFTLPVATETQHNNRPTPHLRIKETPEHGIFPPDQSRNSPGIAMESKDSLSRQAEDPNGSVALNNAGSVHESEILVVDDDPVNLEVVRSQLSLEGMTVTTATNGRQALALIEEGRTFDLALLDVMMPGMTGLELCRAIRRRYNSAELPVIMLTAKNRIADLTEGLDSGANDYLGKPFAREELLARVNAQLKVRRAHETARENSRLRRELEMRARTELELRMTQRRLSAMLDVVSDPMVAVNESRELAFCNRAFEERSRFAAFDLLGKPASTLFDGNAAETLESWLTAMGGSNPSLPSPELDMELVTADGGNWPGRITASVLELEDERLLVLLAGKTQNSAPPSLPWIDDISRNRLRLQQLEETLNGLTPLVLNRHPGFIEDLRAVDRSLERISLEMAPEFPEQDKRHLIVDTMNLAVNLWSEAALSSKADLARASGLWAVYVNQDGWERTQTLDRYLSPDTLPANPRLKKVLATADFVLSSTKSQSPPRSSLEAAVKRLRKLN